MENVITPGVEWGGRRNSSASASLALVQGLAEAGHATMSESEQLALVLDLHRLRTQVDALMRRVAVLEAVTIDQHKPPEPEPAAEQQADASALAQRWAIRSDAEADGRAQAKREGAELVVKGADGKIQRRDSYGADDPNKAG